MKDKFAEMMKGTKSRLPKPEKKPKVEVKKPEVNIYNK